MIETVQTVIEVEGQKVRVNQSPRQACCRLVHDGKNVVALFESEGVTSTKNRLFCGTKEECEAEIARLGLAPQRTDARAEVRRG
jgi:hypothetical protein